MNKLLTFFRRHVGVLILVILVIVFPMSLSSQAKLSLRVIVTGLAIDKSDDGYEVTAQIVKNTPGTESPGTSATLEFVSDKGETISLAIANLSYKIGKVTAFSHVNFVVLGDDIVKDEEVNCLDYFVRDKIIKASTMVLVSDGKAKDEIKKTKDIELSVGLGLQRVFLYKEYEGDGVMQTVLDFLNNSNMYSKTAVVSTLSLISDSEEDSESSSDSSGSDSSSGGSSGSSESGSGEEGSSSSGSSGSSGSGSSGNSSSSGEQSGGSIYFESKAPLACFVNSKFVCKLEDDDFLGYMLGNKNVTTTDIALDGFESEDLKDAKVSINIKNKAVNFGMHFEGNEPCLDITIFINNGEINEILNSNIVATVSDDVYEEIETKTKEKIKSLVSGAFETAKTAGADIFGAYELAYKFNYSKLVDKFDTVDKFVEAMRIGGVDVVINKLDF